MNVSDGMGDRLERRWFAAQNACTALTHECDYIRQSLEEAEGAWRRAHARLRELEAIRDELGQQLAEVDALNERTMLTRRGRVSSAA